MSGVNPRRDGLQTLVALIHSRGKMRNARRWYAERSIHPHAERSVRVSDSHDSLATTKNQLGLALKGTEAETRFWAKVCKSDGCWNWQAAVNEKGYGVFAIGKFTFKAHRLSYLFCCGEFDDGLCLLHSCDNPKCVKPSHLKIGDRNDNNQDMKAKGRHRRGGSKTPVDRCKYERGQSHHNAKINEDIVRELRRDQLAGMSYSKLAKKYGINQTTAHSIAKGKLWKHVN